MVSDAGGQVWAISTLREEIIKHVSTSELLVLQRTSKEEWRRASAIIYRSLSFDEADLRVTNTPNRRFYRALVEECHRDEGGNLNAEDGDFWDQLDLETLNRYKRWFPNIRSISVSLDAWHLSTSVEYSISSDGCGRLQYHRSATVEDREWVDDVYLAPYFCFPHIDPDIEQRNSLSFLVSVQASRIDDFDDLRSGFVDFCFAEKPFDSELKINALAFDAPIDAEMLALLVDALNNRFPRHDRGVHSLDVTIDGTFTPKCLLTYFNELTDLCYTIDIYLLGLTLCRSAPKVSSDTRIQSEDFLSIKHIPVIVQRLANEDCGLRLIDLALTMEASSIGDLRIIPAFPVRAPENGEWAVYEFTLYLEDLPDFWPTSDPFPVAELARHLAPMLDPSAARVHLHSQQYGCRDPWYRCEDESLIHEWGEGCDQVCAGDTPVSRPTLRQRCPG